MTRRLPWKRTASSVDDGDANNLKKRSERAHISPSSATQAGVSFMKKQDSSSDGDDTRPALRTSPATDAAKATIGIFSDDRASSPPPEPLGEAYMKPGIDADDRYRMVEDEFLATAQQFTAHMRAAEYKRLISASRTRNANTIKDISRPVVGRMTDLVRMKTERKARSERTRRELREKKMKRIGKEKGEADGGDEDEAGESGGEGLYGSTSLLGLMDNPNPRKKMAPRLETASSGISRLGREGMAADMPVRTSPTLVRTVEAAPRPTFASIPGLNKKSSVESNRQKQDQKLVDDDDESTGSEDDLDKPSRTTNFPKTTPRSETKGTGMDRSTRPGKTSTITSTSSPSANVLVHKHIREDVAMQSRTSGSTAKESETKGSGSVDSDDDDYDILASLKNRRASAKRRSTGQGGGLGLV